MAAEGKAIKYDEEEDYERKNEKHAKYLNDSIIFNILTRVPADLVHTKYFKYQCRQWHRLISYQDFMDIHTENISQSKPGIIYMERVGHHHFEYRYLLKYLEFSGSGISCVRKLHDFKTTRLIIKSSCNGLLLLQEYCWPHDYRIMNPVTKKQTTSFPAVKNCDYSELVFLGEYKVVELYDANYEAYQYNRHSGIRSYTLRITTLNGEPARDIQVQENCNGKYGYSHVYINGVFYWSFEDHVVSFNLNTEIFRFLQTPESCRFLRFELINIFRSLGLIELLCRSRYNGIHVWSMVEGEWEKVFTLKGYTDFIGVLDHANLYIYKDSYGNLGNLGTYDLQTKKRHPVYHKEYLVQCDNHMFFDHKVHINSFISLNCMV